MRQRDQEWTTDSDSYRLLVGTAEGDDDSIADSLFADEQDEPNPPGRATPGGRPSRAERNRQAHRTGHRRVVGVLAALLVVVVAVSVWLVVLPVYHYLNPDDYSGDGSGSVRVTVLANDGAGDIAAELKAKGVVASVQAFTDAANSDDRSRSIQPGTYLLHRHMSGAAALRLMLDPSARVNDNVVVTEGATTLDVAARLAAKPCGPDTDPSARCGPGYAASAVTAAMHNVTKLGIPPDFFVDGKPPSSVEGFLYPGTYFFPESGAPVAALQQMITRFADQLRSTDFISAAKKNGLSAYQQLTAASIAQSEARYPADMAKVVRVILNRLKDNTPLKIDATSAYAAKLAGQDPTKVVYSRVDSPYNTYTHRGLPPTPISNPGTDALKAAAHPASGNWLYYVNKDAQGHLLFTNSEKEFSKAVARCRANHWGCG